MKKINGRRDLKKLKAEKEEQEAKRKLEEEKAKAQLETVDIHEGLTRREKVQRGKIVQMRIKGNRYKDNVGTIFIVYENHYIAAYDIEKMQQKNVFGPFEAAQINIDEPCSVVSILDKDKQRVSVKLIQYEFKIRKDVGSAVKETLRRNVLKKTLFPFKRMTLSVLPDDIPTARESSQPRKGKQLPQKAEEPEAQES